MLTMRMRLFCVLKLSVTKIIDFYISAASLTEIFYILNKTLKDIEKSKSLIRNILKFVSIAGVDDTCIINALNSTWPDFEDSVQHEVASQIRADYIVTRNIKDYRNSTIVVVTPTEFISRV
ncbi:PIN domain-containing protein [Treponema sp.]|uniref:PIN domain-containing protein n=1 Tax=Treponema sp. TaxID=166 RepID=UPI0039C5F256